MIPFPINEETSDKFPANDGAVTPIGKAFEKITVKTTEKTTENTTESIAENIVEYIVENLEASLRLQDANATIIQSVL